MASGSIGCLGSRATGCVSLGTWKVRPAGRAAGRAAHLPLNMAAKRQGAAALFSVATVVTNLVPPALACAVGTGGRPSSAEGAASAGGGTYVERDLLRQALGDARQALALRRKGLPLGAQGRLRQVQLLPLALRVCNDALQQGLVHLRSLCCQSCHRVEPAPEPRRALCTAFWRPGSAAEQRLWSCSPGCPAESWRRFPESDAQQVAAQRPPLALQARPYIRCVLSTQETALGSASHAQHTCLLGVLAAQGRARHTSMPAVPSSNVLRSDGHGLKCLAGCLSISDAVHWQCGAGHQPQERFMATPLVQCSQQCGPLA